MAVTYHEWTAFLRVHTKERAAKGMLGVIAALSGIPEGRLNTWAFDDTARPLSHAEFQALHEALAEHISMAQPEKELKYAASNESGVSSGTARADNGSTSIGRTARIEAFDSSD